MSSTTIKKERIEELRAEATTAADVARREQTNLQELLVELTSEGGDGMDSGQTERFETQNSIVKAAVADAEAASAMLKEAMDEADPLAGVRAKHSESLLKFLKGEPAEKFGEGEREAFIGEAGDGLEIFNLTTPASLPAGVFPLRTSGDVTATLAYLGGMRMASTVINGDWPDEKYPGLPAETAVGEILAEAAPSTKADVAEYSDVEFSKYRYGSKRSSETLERLNSAVVNVAANVEHTLMGRLGRVQNADFTSGDGVANAQGAETIAKTVGIGAAVDTLTIDHLRTAIGSVDQAYLVGNEGFRGQRVARPGVVAFMMHRDTWLFGVAAIKLGDSFPYRQPLGHSQGLRDKVEPMIDGYPVIFNNAMDSPGTDGAFGASAETALLFGNFGYHVIRDVSGIEVVRYSGDVLTRAASMEFEIRQWSNARAIGAIAAAECQAIVSLATRTA